MDSRGVGVLASSSDKEMFQQLIPSPAEAWLAMPAGFRDNNIDPAWVKRSLRTAFQQFPQQSHVVVTKLDTQKVDGTKTLSSCIQQSCKGTTHQPNSTRVFNVCAGLFRVRQQHALVASMSETERNQYNIIEQLCIQRKVPDDGIAALVKHVQQQHAQRCSRAMVHAIATLKQILSQLDVAFRLAISTTQWSDAENNAAEVLRANLMTMVRAGRDQRDEAVTTLFLALPNQTQQLQVSVSKEAHLQALEELRLHKPCASTLRTWMKQPDGCFRSRAKSSLQGAGSGLMVRAHMLMASYQFTGCEQEWLSYHKSIERRCSWRAPPCSTASRHCRPQRLWTRWCSARG